MFFKRLKMAAVMLTLSAVLITGVPTSAFAGELDTITEETDGTAVEDTDDSTQVEEPDTQIEEPDTQIEEPDTQIEEPDTQEPEPETQEPEVEEGWVEDQYLVDGVAVTGLYTIEDVTYGFDTEGHLIHGTARINKKYYYFDENGAMVKGWVELNGQTLYYGADGTLTFGPTRINGNYYFFNTANGAMKKSEFVEWNGQTLYYGADGILVKGPARIGKDYYFFNTANGAMKKSEFVQWNGQTLYYGADGKLVKGPATINGKEYFFNTANGAMKVNETVTYNGTTAYYGADGVKVSGTQYITTASVNMRSGAGTSYSVVATLPADTRVTVTQTKTADGKTWGKTTYNGKTGWFSLAYAIRDEVANTTVGYWKQSGSTWIYFNKDGTKRFTSNAMHTAYTKIADRTSGTKYYVVVDKSHFHVFIFANVDNTWVPLKDMLCDVGKSSTPTPSGTFTIGGRFEILGLGGSSWEYYVTHIDGYYYFHSTLYYPGTPIENAANAKVKNGTLGAAISHGCVRLALSNAKWIYYNIPRGTGCLIY